ncbi:MAG: response regulator [Nitrospira sp.]
MSRMYERAFRASDYTMEIASDGEEALSKLEKMDVLPTVILLDVMMPKKNGFDVLKELKENDKFKNIPVIMLTNLAGEDDAEKGLSLGAIVYLIKSQYDPKQIVDKVREIVDASDRDSGVPKVNVEVKDIEDK